MQDVFLSLQGLIVLVARKNSSFSCVLQITNSFCSIDRGLEADQKVIAAHGCYA